MALYIAPGAEPGQAQQNMTQGGPITKKRFEASLFVIVPIAVIVGIIALWRYDSRYGMTALGIVIVIVAGLMFWLKDKRLLY